MDFTVHKINPEKGIDCGLAEDCKIDIELYSKAFTARYPVASLDELLRVINYGGSGCTIEVGDIVEVTSSADIAPGFYYCDDCDFIPVELRKEVQIAPTCDKIAASNREEPESVKEIKEIRAITGLSQVKFAEALHIPRRTLEAWESDSGNCPVYIVELLRYRVEHDKKLRKKETKKKSSAAKLEELRKAGADEVILEEFSTIE